MPRPLNILLVEDDTIEIMKFMRVVKECEIKHTVTTALNGNQALELLSDRALQPDIIILDLNMPELNGIGFLGLIKQDDFRKNIPTIIYSSSNNHKDVNTCYSLGAAGYMVKPLKHADYLVNTARILEYWSNNECLLN